MLDHDGHPIRSAERALEVMTERPTEAIEELAHGLASLGRQHNDLEKRVERIEKRIGIERG